MKAPEASQENTDLYSRATFGLSVTGVVALTPMVLYDFFTGQFLVGVIALFLVVVSTINIITIKQGWFSPLVNSYLLIPGTIVCLIYVVMLLGMAGVLWVYPVIMSFYAIVPERRAWTSNTALLVALIPVMMSKLDSPELIRAMVTLLVVSAFSVTFTRIINRQQRQLADRVLIDPLTGLYNRSSLETTIVQAIDQHRSHGKNMTLIALDLDHFKQINDTEGHSIGDQVLQQLGSTLRESVRQSDYVFRMGGEEFLVLLTGANLRAGNKVAQLLRRKIEATEFPCQMRVTASVSVATLQPDESADTWLTRVDQLLYQAKEHGRNCIVTEPSQLVPAVSR